MYLMCMIWFVMGGALKSVELDSSTKKLKRIVAFEYDWYRWEEKKVLKYLKKYSIDSDDCVVSEGLSEGVLSSIFDVVCEVITEVMGGEAKKDGLIYDDYVMYEVFGDVGEMKLMMFWLLMLSFGDLVVEEYEKC